MDQIISDCYYIIGLHQERFKTINSIRLNNLLYLLDSYYMCLEDGNGLYKEGFNMDLLGPYIKSVNGFFRKRERINYD